MNVTICKNFVVKTKQLIEGSPHSVQKNRKKIPQSKFYIVHKWGKRQEIMFLDHDTIQLTGQYKNSIYSECSSLFFYYYDKETMRLNQDQDIKKINKNLEWNVRW